MSQKSKKLVKYGTIAITGISMICGIVMIKASSFLLHETVEYGNTLVNKTWTALAGHSIETDSSEAILLTQFQIYGSATALVGGVLQFLVSMLTLVIAVRGAEIKGQTILLWVAFHVIIMLATYGSYLTIITTKVEIEETDATKFFLPASIGNLTFLLTSLAVELVFLRMFL